jgi:hypothetical protein
MPVASKVLSPLANSRQLEATRYGQQYRDRLAKAAVLFRRWVVWSALFLPLGGDAYDQDAVWVDDTLASFVQYCYDAKVAYTVAVHAVLYAQVARPRLRKCLSTAWSRLSSWRLERPVRLRVPMPLPILNAAFVYALHLGFTADVCRAALWIPLAVCLRIGYFGLLRPIEIDQLTRLHLALPSDAALGIGQRLVCTLIDPKNRLSAGRMQFAIVDDSCTLAWAAWLLRSVPSSWRLFPGTQASFAALFRELFERMRLGHLGFTPASLRAGGATNMFLEGVSIDRLKFQGRWRALGTLEHYIQEAVSCLILCRLEPNEAACVTRLNLFFANGTWPPAEHWHAYFSRRNQHAKRRARSLPVRRATALERA